MLQRLGTVVLVGMFPLLTRSLAGQGILTGTVRQDSAFHPLANVEVLIQGMNRSVLTLASGSYRVDSIPAGTYLVQYRLAGFRLARQTVVVRDRFTIILDATLSRDPSAARRQAAQSSGPKPVFPTQLSWDVSISLGVVLLGPPSAMRNYLANEGWSSNGSEIGPGFSAAVSRELSQRVRIAGAIGVGLWGEVRAGTPSHQLRASWTSIVVEPGIWYKLHPVVSVGAGPLVGLVTSSATVPPSRNEIVPGAFAGVSFRSPLGRGFFVDVSAIGRLLASHREGPWAVTSRAQGASAEPEPEAGPAEGKIGQSHASLSVGVGWRF